MANLTLRITRYWFDQILAGYKKTEFRDLTPYYAARIDGKAFDRVILIAGYGKMAPVLSVRIKKIVKSKARGRYEIKMNIDDFFYFDSLAEFQNSSLHSVLESHEEID